jgi:ubiquinone/menaquinone biosynthesis C-methylase UbiE
MSFNEENNEIQETEILYENPQNSHHFVENDEDNILKNYLNTIEIDVLEMNKKRIIEGCNKIYKINNLNIICHYFEKLMESIEICDNSYNKEKIFELLKIIQVYIDKIIIMENTHTSIILSKFIKLISICKNGHFMLVKYKDKFSQCKNIYTSYILSKAKFQSFKIMFDTLDSLNLKFNEMKNIIESAAFNYDDRVYQFIMNFYRKNFIEHDEAMFSMSFFNSILRHPPKYIFKRLKYIEDIINQKDEYIYNLFSSIKITIELFTRLAKFYYINKPNIIFNYIIINKFINNIGPDSKILFNLMKTNNEKLHFCSVYLNYYKILIDEKYLNQHILLSVFPDLFFDFYKIGNDKYTDSKLDIIIKCFKNSNPFNSKKFKLFLLPYLKDVNIEDKDKNKCKIYYIYIKLSTFIRRIKMRKIIIRKMILSPLISELNNLKPNGNIKVMKNGTMFYQNRMQQFNNIPPHHMFPNEIEGMKNILIREKADGTLVTELPKNIFPEISFDCKIKAEYIEELDLYLVFDIDTEMSIENRYNYLRTLHDDTFKTSLMTINSIEQMIEYINIERDIFSKFMNKDYNTYRWYPKVAFKIEYITNEIAKSFYDFINMESPLNEHNVSGYYENDGYIITPLDCLNEIKIKPKNKMTIDLECKNKQMFDRDGNIYGVENLNNGIYRKYPNGTFEYRYDKFKANPYNVVNNIINLSKIYYKVNNKLYYNDIKYNYDYTWDIITKNNNNNFIKTNKLMYPEESILDLGCGKGKVLSLLSKSNNNYTGYDFDHYILNKARSKFNYVIFNYIDLRNDWDNTNEKYYDVKYKYYKNIYAINSLMHFNTDKFWHQLNKVSTKGTRFMFNLLSDNQNVWEYKDSFLRKKEKNVELYFQFIHNKQLTEKFITINDVMPYFEKYHFNIIYEKQYENQDINYHSIDNLTSLYTWYVVEKN